MSVESIFKISSGGLRRQKTGLESSFCLAVAHVLKNWFRLEDRLVRSQPKQMNIF